MKRIKNLPKVIQSIRGSAGIETNFDSKAYCIVRTLSQHVQVGMKNELLYPSEFPAV